MAASLSDSQNQALIEFRQKLNALSEVTINFDDDLLVKFLKSYDFNVSQTVKLFLEYCNSRKNRSHVFVPISDLCQRFEKPLFVHCPKHPKDELTMVYIPLRNWNVSKNTLGEAFEYFVPHSEFCGLDKNVQDNGVIMFIDVTDVGFSYLPYFTPSQIQYALLLLEHLIPVKYISIYVIFCSKVIEIMYKLSKPFLSERMQKSLKFCNHDITELFDKFGRDRLPTEMGGYWEIKMSSVEELKDMDDALLKYWHKYGLIDK